MTISSPVDDEIFARRLVPHRSLSRRNFHVLMMVFAASCFFSSLPFILLGAWPVGGFMGLDVLAFFLAFRANFRAARAYEDVRVTALELQVSKVSSKGTRLEWRFNPTWVRLEREEHEEFGTQRLAIVSRGSRLEVAGFLGPDAKAEFADGLSLALAEARRGARFS